MARRSRAGAGALILLAGLLSPGGGTAGAEGGSPAAFRGHLETRPIVYLHDGDPDAQAWFRSHLAWEKRLTRRFIVRAEGDLDLDTHGEVGRDLLYDDDERGIDRAILRFTELSLAWTTPLFEVSAGRLVIPWGRADGFNPTDNLSPWDTLDPLDPERLSQWALRGRLFAGPVTLEGDYLPAPEPTRLPQIGGRWLPLPETVPNPLFPLAGPEISPADWEYGEAAYPAWRPENAAWGVKVDYRGSRWEGSLSHYDGWEDQPALSVSAGAPAGARFQIPLALDRTLAPLEATGADLAWVLGRFVLRAEAARHRREDPAEAEFTFGILEGEWTLGNWRFIAGWAEISGDEGRGTATFLLEQAVLPAAILYVERSIPTGLQASLQILSNLEGEGLLSRADVSWPFGPGFRAGIGADLLSGPEGTILGSFQENDRVRGSLRWSF